VVQHEEDQALAGLDEPLGIQAKPSPCSLARTVRKSGTTPHRLVLAELYQMRLLCSRANSRYTKCVSVSGGFGWRTVPNLVRAGRQQP
jgi:hypothetical protein